MFMSFSFLFGNLFLKNLLTSRAVGWLIMGGLFWAKSGTFSYGRRHPQFCTYMSNTINAKTQERKAYQTIRKLESINEIQDSQCDCEKEQQRSFCNRQPLTQQELLCCCLVACCGIAGVTDTFSAIRTA